MNNSDKTLLETLKRSKIYRDYETAFRDAVGLPLSLTPTETWGLPLHEDRNESPFCRIMAAASKTCAACLELQGKLHPDDAAASETCVFGLCDSAVPVKVGDRLIGYLRTGQVFTRTPTELDFTRTIETLTRWGATVEIDELRSAFFGTKILTPPQYQAILRLLEVFAAQLSTLSNQILVSEETQENPQIKRAKAFIAANMAEEISLADCARASHMSTFYFCKLFKRGTGLTFTDYLSRLRTERAKERLLDPHVRISEVAFEVGFQSLSQFNRAFRKITGRSPTDYRANLVSKTRPEGFSDSDSRPGRRFRYGVARRRGSDSLHNGHACKTVA